MSPSRALTWGALVAVVALAAAVGHRPIEDGDLFWHLALGRWTLEHGALLPDVDPFTYNARSAPVQHEWLAQVALAALARVGGLHVLRWLGALWFSGLAVVAFLAFRRRGAGDAPAVAATAAWVLLAAPHAVVRPHLFAWLPALLVAGWLLEAPTRRRVAAGIAVVVVWANLHASVVLAPAWAAACGATAALLAVRAGRSVRQAAAPWGLHLIWTALASLAQPEGWRIWPYVLHTPEVNRALSNEWWPLWRGDVAAGRPWLLGLWAVLGGAVVVALVGALRQPMVLARAPGPLLSAAAVVHAGLTRRMTALLFVPLLWLLERLASRASPPPRWALRAGALLVTAFTLWGAAPETRGWDRPAALRPGVFPVTAAAFVETTRLAGRPVHPDGWGGYLAWSQPAGQQTFADGRWPLVGAQVIADGVAMLTRQSPQGPRFDRYRVDWLLQPTALAMRVPPPAPSRWVLAWRDDTAVVMLRRGPHFAANVRRVCAFFRRRAALRRHGTWHLRASGPPGVPTPTDVPSVLTLCSGSPS